MNIKYKDKDIKGINKYQYIKINLNINIKELNKLNN